MKMEDLDAIRLILVFLEFFLSFVLIFLDFIGFNFSIIFYGILGFLIIIVIVHCFLLFIHIYCLLDSKL